MPTSSILLRDFTTLDVEDDAEKPNDFILHILRQPGASSSSYIHFNERSCSSFIWLCFVFINNGLMPIYGCN
jgi:hypothetical protein